MRKIFTFIYLLLLWYFKKSIKILMKQPNTEGYNPFD